MTRFERIKRAAIIGDNFVAVAYSPWGTLVACKRCGLQIEVPRDATEENDPTLRHDCAPRPLHPALVNE